MEILRSGLVDLGSLFCTLNIGLRRYGQIIIGCLLCCKLSVFCLNIFLNLRAFIFNLLKRILLIRQFLCSFLQMSALQFFLFCLVKKLIYRHQFTNTLFNDIPLKDRSGIRLHDASF